jgi:3-oxoacyl-[acyl-carrier-protein] synthase-3
MMRARITGTGSFAPSKVLTNSDLEKMVDTSDEWIKTRTGIKERRIAEADETASDLATKAASQALEKAKVQSDELGLIIVATVTPDMIFPSTACFVQKNLKAQHASAFDVSAACSGFLYALDIGDKYITSGCVEKALIIGVDLFSKIINWGDRNTCILFGDGAGAVVLERNDAERGILSTHIYSDGNYSQILYAPESCTSSDTFAGAVNDRKGVLMQGNETFKVAIKNIEDASMEALQHNNFTSDDVDLFIPHQANARIIKAVAERMKLPKEKVFTNIEKYGNTSAASIPFALDEAVTKKKLKEGDLLLLASFGGGLVWASALIRW